MTQTTVEFGNPIFASEMLSIIKTYKEGVGAQHNLTQLRDDLRPRIRAVESQKSAMTVLDVYAFEAMKKYVLEGKTT